MENVPSIRSWLFADELLEALYKVVRLFPDGFITVEFRPGGRCYAIEIRRLGRAMSIAMAVRSNYSWRVLQDPEDVRRFIRAAIDTLKKEKRGRIVIRTNIPREKLQNHRRMARVIQLLQAVSSDVQCIFGVQVSLE